MKRFLTLDEEIMINQFSQKIHNLDAMHKWFDSYDLSNKRDIIGNLFLLFLQSSPTVEDIETVATQIGKLKSSAAIILLNKNKPFQKFGYKISDLPENELSTSFDILLLTFSVSDNRRKKCVCLNRCQHWWHQDLSDEDYLKKLHSSNIH